MAMSREEILDRLLTPWFKQQNPGFTTAAPSSTAPRPYVAEYDAGQQRRDTWNVGDFDWATPDTLSRAGTTPGELQRAFNQLSDADKIRAGNLGPNWILEQAGLRAGPAPGSGFGGASPRDPVTTRPPTRPVSPFDPSLDPLPPPAEMPPEYAPVAPEPPPTPWIDQAPPTLPVETFTPTGSTLSTIATGAAPVTAPPAPQLSTPAATASPPVSAGSVPAPPPGPTSATGDPYAGVGPGPYPPYLGGQATWGNPTDPSLLPFTPGSILPPGRGGGLPPWWAEMQRPSQLAPPGFPTAYNNPYFGNTGGFNVGSPYFAPMSTWGFYPMPHMAQHMPGSFGMVTPGMGSWYTGAPVGFNPTPGTSTGGTAPGFPPLPSAPGLNGGLNNAPGMRAAMPAMGAAPSGGAGTSMQPFQGNMAGIQTARPKPAWQNFGGMFVGGGM